MISETVRRAQAGEEAAFTELFAKHRMQVYRLCLGRTNSHEQAEDLVQETFLQVYLKIGSFRGDAAFTTWLYRIAWNLTLMSFRKKQLTTVSVEDLAPDSTAFARRDGQLDNTSLRVALTTAMAQLPRGQRDVFQRKYIDGLAHHEIAGQLGCSLGNSKSQCYKANHKLRSALEGSLR